VKVSLYAGTKHSFGTDAAARGVSERALQTFLGHADAALDAALRAHGRRGPSRGAAPAAGRGRGAGRESAENSGSPVVPVGDVEARFDVYEGLQGG